LGQGLAQFAAQANIPNVGQIKVEDGGPDIGCVGFDFQEFVTG
jgi:hypothetical protein